MEVIIDPGPVSGHIKAPPSKSYSQRAFAAALLHHGTTTITNMGMAADELAALEIITQLGAKVNRRETCIEVTGNGINSEHGFISCGESGLAARLFTPIAALSLNPVHVQGAGSLLTRPMETFNTVLPQLGVTLPHFNGFVPFTVNGPLAAQSVRVDGAHSSQFLSGLLFALCYRAHEAVTVAVDNLKSTPYMDLTLEVLTHFGKHVTHNNYTTFYIDPAKFTHQHHITIDVEGDWSSAAYWLVAGAVNGHVTVKGLSLQSAQADKAILQLLADIKARITISGAEIEVRTSDLEPFEFDATHCPDLFPILAILAACCNGDSYITGVHRLHHKESNRAESIAEMLLQFEVPFSIEDDVLCITGVNGLERTAIDTYNDHRIVMAASIGALRANGPVLITGAEAINKSYPHFLNNWPRLVCGAPQTDNNMNTFGRIFRISIFGESHGMVVGVTIDGCPPGILLHEADMLPDLERRKAGAAGTTPRKEEDAPRIVSGMFNGTTTGAPITLFFENSNTRSADYEAIRKTPRPGHADWVLNKKYNGFNDYRGGGHSSGRLTLALVAAGVVAKKILAHVTVTATLTEAGGDTNIDAAIAKATEQQDSIGGIVTCRVCGLPASLGEPFFDSVESAISHIIFSIPAIKGIEFGSGFAAARMTGSAHNDAIIDADGSTRTNNAGGINGGITNGNDLHFRVAVKPTSSTPKEQQTWNNETQAIAPFTVMGRHDLCIALRVPVVVEAAAAIALADLLLIANM